jgi:hypothetical protein
MNYTTSSAISTVPQMNPNYYNRANSSLIDIHFDANGHFLLGMAVVQKIKEML